jgi:hypothetical protein
MSQAAEARFKKVEARVASLEAEIERLRKMIHWNDPWPLEHLPKPPRQLAVLLGER